SASPADPGFSCAPCTLAQKSGPPRGCSPSFRSAKSRNACASRSSLSDDSAEFAMPAAPDSTSLDLEKKVDFTCAVTHVTAIVLSDAEASFSLRKTSFTPLGSALNCDWRSPTGGAHFP